MQARPGPVFGRFSGRRETNRSQHSGGRVWAVGTGCFSGVVPWREAAVLGGVGGTCGVGEASSAAAGSLVVAVASVGASVGAVDRAVPVEVVGHRTSGCRS